MDIKALSEKYKEYVIDLRRYFHAYPEQSLMEYNTSKKIKEELTKLNIPFISIAGTGILATISGKKSGKTIALRADMDALEICEHTDVDYRSKNSNFMHACGHDGHIASLLGAAKILKELEEELKGTVKLIFQPAEETGGGAILLIKEGVLQGVDEIFGIHVISDIPYGKVSVEAGAAMASADAFKIIVKGKGGHGARPAQAIDSIVAASAIVLNLQTLISREIDTLEPAVVSVGTFKAGTSYNIIANEAILEGTTRCFSNEIRTKIPEALERISKNTASAFRAEIDFQYDFSVSPVINNAVSAALAEGSVEKLLSKSGIYKAGKLLIAEDFSEYLNLVPGAFAFVGARNEAKEACYPHHNDKFNIDEDCLQVATALYAQYAMDFLNNL